MIIKNDTTLEEKIYEIFRQKITKIINISEMPFVVEDKDFLSDYKRSDSVLQTSLDIFNLGEPLGEFDLEIEDFVKRLWNYGEHKYWLYNHINERKFYNVYTTACIEALKSFRIDGDISWKETFNKCIRVYIESLDSRYWIATRKSALEVYLKEVEYISNDISLDENIEFCPENKDRLIKQNLKAVIGAAKKYQGLGLELEDLISAGNLGLCIAWDRFDPKRAQAKENVLQAIEIVHNKTHQDSFTKQECIDIFTDVFSYGKRIDYLTEKLPETITYQGLLNFINRYVQSAKFSSVANSWIRAYILSELDINSRIVKKPKSEIYKDKEETGSFVKEVTFDIMQPVVGSDKQTSHGLTLGDLLGNVVIQSSEEKKEEQELFKRALSKMMTGIKARDKRIVFKKFGIGVPRELSPKEIAASEGISVARVSQILQSSFDHIQRNVGTEDYNIEELFYMVKSID